jgi:hypothetical protein
LLGGLLGLLHAAARIQSGLELDAETPEAFGKQPLGQRRGGFIVSFSVAVGDQ